MLFLYMDALTAPMANPDEPRYGDGLPFPAPDRQWLAMSNARKAGKH